MKFDADRLRANLREVMKREGLSVNGWATRANVSESALRTFLSQNSPRDNITVMTLDALAGVVDMTIEQLITGAEPYVHEQEKRIPAYESIAVAAGAPMVLNEPVRPESSIPYKLAKGGERRDIRAIKVEPDSYSMNRFAVPGQYLIVDFDQTDPGELDGKLVIACVDGACTFKRWKRNPDRLVPESTHPDYHPMTVNQYDNFRIIGRVIDVVADRKGFE